MKKALSLLLALIISVSCFSVLSTAYDAEVGEEIILEDIASAVKRSNLSINANNRATCTSVFSDINSNIYSIKAEQTLEKHWALGIFFAVDNASWEKTVYTDNLSMTNYKYSLESGTYRLKTVFTVFLNNNQTETITVYSSEETIS